ncbi:MAG TPA: rhamnogalacturonan acetylesterase [Bacteroidota bacterium]
MKSLASIVLLFTATTAIVNPPITVYLAGDSTMAEKQAKQRPETGWGERLQQYFDAETVHVENHAKGGRSTRTFIEEGRWQAIIDSLKEGDFVFIQFGHNDQAKTKVERYTSPEDYRTNLIRFVGDVRLKKGHPVLMTPVMRRRFNEQGKFYDTHGVYPEIVREVARDQNVPLIDMHRKTEALIKTLGEQESMKLFVHLKPNEHPNYPEGKEDNTHYSEYGAEETAKLAVEGIKELELPLAAFIKKP